VAVRLLRGFLFPSSLQILSDFRSQIVLLQTSNLHERSQQTNLQRLIAMNRNDDSFSSSRHRKNVVTAVNAGECPTVLLKNPRKFATGDLFYTATSIT
jgi:hypothetical protein